MLRSNAMQRRQRRRPSARLTYRRINPNLAQNSEMILSTKSTKSYSFVLSLIAYWIASSYLGKFIGEAPETVCLTFVLLRLAFWIVESAGHRIAWYAHDKRSSVEAWVTIFRENHLPFRFGIEGLSGYLSHLIEDNSSPRREISEQAKTAARFIKSLLEHAASIGWVYGFNSRQAAEEAFWICWPDAPESERLSDGSNRVYPPWGKEQQRNEPST